MAFRNCSGGIVLREKKGELQVLLVKSMRGKKWTLPKGGVEAHLTPESNAVKEVFEEAGVLAEINYHLGRYEYTKNDTLQMVQVFLMRSLIQVDKYPECKIRKRKWVPAETAYSILNKNVAKLLQKAVLYYKNPGMF